MDTHVIYCLFWVGFAVNLHSTGHILPKVHFKVNNEQGDCENYTGNNCHMRQTVVCMSVFGRLISQFCPVCQRRQVQQAVTAVVLL